MFWIVATVILLGIAALLYKSNTITDGGDTYHLRPWAAGVFVLWLLVTLVLSINTVPAGHIGLVKTFGEYTGEQSPGLNFKAPYQAVEKVDGRVLKKKVSMLGGNTGTAGSSDNQVVYAEIVVNYQVELDEARDLYNEVGASYYSKIVEPAVQSAFKNEVSTRKAIEIPRSREEIRREVVSVLEDKLADKGVVVVDVVLKNIEFSDEFAAAIERKQTATEDAKAAQERVAIAKADADAVRETARGEADALAIKGKAARENQDAVALAWIDKINPKVEVIYLDPRGSLVQIPSSRRGG